MFKKLLLLAVAAVLGITANAKIEQAYFIDYTAQTWNFYVMGYIPSQDNGWLTITQPYGSMERVDGEVVLTPGEDKDEDGNPDPVWYQLFVADGIPTSPGVAYTVTIYGKADVEATSNMNMQWGWGDGQQMSMQVPFTTEWSEIEVTYPEFGGSSGALILQPGTQTTTFEIQWIKVTYNAKEDTTEWIDHLINGNAEGEFGDVPCVYTKEYGYNDNNPHPAFIELEGDNHVFVCHAAAVNPDDFLNDDGTQSGAHAWQNQIWIQSPQAWNEGDMFRVSFRYKASTKANTNTQCHNQNPGEYLHWYAIGDVLFDTEWKEFSKVVTVESAMAGMWSIAFNLNPQVFDAIDFYIDDVKWETMKLDEGWFIAGDFQEDEWDLGSAVEMIWDDGEGFYAATVGTSKPASVVKISTVRGNDSAFNNATINLMGEFDPALAATEDGCWRSYETKAAKKITLPFAGAWTICVDPAGPEIGLYVADEGGVNSVMFDANGSFEFYNLQGVQVANPIKGQVYIMKQGSKVAKVLYR